MRLDYLQKILAHVKNGLTCPRCQAVFGAAELKIVSIKAQALDVCIDCPHCDTTARVSAQVTTGAAKRRTRTKTKPTAPRAVDAAVSAQAHITPEGLENLRREITHLSASDIEGLEAEKS